MHNSLLNLQASLEALSKRHQDARPEPLYFLSSKQNEGCEFIMHQGNAGKSPFLSFLQLQLALPETELSIAVKFAGLNHPSDEKFVEDLVRDHLASLHRAAKEAWAETEPSEQNEESLSIDGGSCEGEIQRAVQNNLEQREGRQTEAGVTPTDDESAAAATMLDLAAGQ